MTPSHPRDIPLDLPGADLIARGLTDLEAGRRTRESWLVQIGRPRLLRLGLEVTAPIEDDPQIALYRLLEHETGPLAYSRYGSLLRRLLKFARSYESHIRSTRRTLDSAS